MKIHRRIERKKGSVLATTLVLVAIFGISMMAVLRYANTQNRNTWRSLYWNECLPLAEAGIEDGLVSVQQNGLEDLGQSGWTWANDRWVMERELEPGSNERYRVELTGNGLALTNTATARIRLPDTLGGGYVQRTVRVVATNDAMFRSGLVGIDHIDFNNQQVSFGCGTTAANGGGGLLTLNIAAHLGVLNLVDICLQGNATVGADGIAAGAGLGVSGLLNIGSATDLNVHFPDPSAPFPTAAPPATSVTVGGTNYTYAVNGDTLMTSLSLTGTQRLIVTGDSTLYVLGDINVRDSGFIYVRPGVKLRIFAGGESTVIRGGGIINGSHDPVSVQYFGLGSNTSVELNGPSTFEGLIYAPQALISLGKAQSSGGLGSILSLGVLVSTSDRLLFRGGIVGKTVLFTSSTEYHYDSNWAVQGPRRGYVVYSWEEI